MNSSIFEQSEQLQQILINNKNNFSPILGTKYKMSPLSVFDLSEKNKELQNIDMNNTAVMTKYLFDIMKNEGTDLGIGQYDEDRIIYQRSGLFENPEDARSLHVGIDLWVPAETPIYAPLSGKVHSFADNDHFGDYGPTIILEHILDGQTFYTLYGHLSRESLSNIKTGQEIQAGEAFAFIGDFPINGDWPPHLHFQIITDILDKKGDFPGVASLSERDYYLALCPNPNLILQIDI
jgi:murein DD-endopeptidase MepM/ murein hydrolase activator NlpD